MSNDKQSEEALFESAVKTTSQILYDKGFFDSYDNADELLKDHLHIDKFNERRGLDVQELNDNNVTN